jgi:hypothetical protein
MTRGADLTARDVQHAVEYNRSRFDGRLVERIQKRIGQRPASGVVDAPFVRAVADWQEAHFGTGQGNGQVGPTTEAHLHLLLPEAERAVLAAHQMLARGGYLYDGWNNDMRDNDGDGLVDMADPSERPDDDGRHYGQMFSSFGVRRGSYRGGWDFARRDVSVHADSVHRAGPRRPFLYRNCADIISEAYRAAGVMPHHRQTIAILNEFRRRGYVWQRDLGYPDEYLPGDFICTYSPGRPGEHGGGHSGIVVEAGRTNGGRSAPVVIDLPGPSSQVSEGIYSPANTNDLQRHRWPAFRISGVPLEEQFLGRLLHSRLHGHH